jgi:hypothetical protein
MREKYEMIKEIYEKNREEAIAKGQRTRNQPSHSKKHYVHAP